MWRFACLVLMICAAQGLQQENNPTDAVREKDAYAIYSLMLTNPRTSHGPDDNERYLIAGTTAPGQPPEPCVQPPKERDADFRQVLADYERRKATPRQLKRLLSISKPYVLLSADQKQEFIKSRSLGRKIGSDAVSEQFRGGTDLFTLWDVYFNEKQTLALTGISTWCGGLCGLYQWKVFEKLDTGKWEERPWVGCMTIADKVDGEKISAALPIPSRREPLKATGYCTAPVSHIRAATPDCNVVRFTVTSLPYC